MRKNGKHSATPVLMGTKLKIGDNSNLYDFWRESVTDNLLNEIKEDKFLVNLSSDEYFKVINKKQFFAIVEKGKTGTIGNMPAWKRNVKVMDGREALYSYLKARSDGAIGQIKPKKAK